MMKVEIAETAKADLRDIAYWIAADNPAAAERFVTRLLAAVRSLDRLSKRYPYVGLGEYRRMPHKNYLVFYLVTDKIYVARILHAARDWPNLLDDAT